MPNDPLVGRRIGDYTILRLLGEGGMARVYLARQERLRRLVAFKVLGAEEYGEEERLTRFRREIEACTSLSHGNVVRIFDAGTMEGTLWYSMELVEGNTLEDPERAGLTEIADVLRVARQLADALDVIHRHGMVHRDIKPANVMVDGTGTCRLMDFGLVSLSERTAITKEGDVLGTLMFMPPEGVSGKDVGPAGDIYAFGMTLYWLVSRCYPFPCEDLNELCMAVLMTEAPRLDDLRKGLPRGLSHLVARCMAKDEAARPSRASSIMVELDAIANGSWSPDLLIHLEDEASSPDEESPELAVAAAQATASETGPSTPVLFFLGLTAAIIMLGMGTMFFRLVGAAEALGRSWDFEGLGGHCGLALHWQSERAYPSIVEVEGGDGVLRRHEGKTPTLRHRIVVLGLKAGRSHRWRVVYPDGTRSVWRKAQTWSREDLLEVSRKIVTTERGVRLLLSFRMPVALKLQARLGGREIRRSEAAVADRSHTLMLPDAPDLYEPVRFQGRIETAAGEGLDVDLPPLPTLGTLLLEEGRSERVQAWVDRFYKVGKTAPETLDKTIERFRRSRLFGFTRLTLPRVSAYLLDGAVPLARRIELLNCLQDIARVDQVLGHWTRLDPLLDVRKALRPVLRVETHFPAPPIRSRQGTRLLELARDADLFLPVNTPPNAWGGLEKVSSVFVPAVVSEGRRVTDVHWKARFLDAYAGQGLCFALCIGRRDFPNYYVLEFSNGLKLYGPKPGGLRGDQSIAEIFVMAGGRDLLRDSLSVLSLSIHRAFLPRKDGRFQLSLHTYADWVLFPDVLRSIWFGPEGQLFDLGSRGW